MNATAEEHSLNFEHREGVDVTVKVDEVAKNIFRADGMLTRLMQKMREMLAMSQPDRGPDPGYVEDGERIMLPVSAIERLLRKSSNQRNGDDENNWKTIALFVMGFLQALILAFMGYIYSATSDTHDDVIRIKCRLDPQSCMGSPNAKP